MATTVNYEYKITGTSTLAAPGAAWTKILDGALSSASFIESRHGEIEYAEAPTSTAPATSFFGHILTPGESQNIASLAASQSIYVRAFGKGGAVLVVTPGAA